MGWERNEEEGKGQGRTGDGVDEVAVDEELGELDLHLGHLEPVLAAPVRIRHAAGRGEMRGVWLTWLCWLLGLGEWCAAGLRQRSRCLLKGTGRRGRGLQRTAADSSIYGCDSATTSALLSFFFLPSFSVTSSGRCVVPTLEVRDEDVRRLLRAGD
jgi:hypothetical protein